MSGLRGIERGSRRWRRGARHHRLHLTLLEVLVVPYRAGHRQLAERYEALLTRSQGIRMIELTRDQLRAAAQLRAATGAKTADAVHLVSAFGAGCKTFGDQRPASPDGTGPARACA